MLVECKHCGHRLDPNAEDAPWGPPVSRPPSDAGSLTCPKCNKQEDFSDWKAITSASKASSDSE